MANDARCAVTEGALTLSRVNVQSISPGEIDKAVDKAIGFLEEAQLPSGHFPMELAIREGWKETGELGAPIAERSLFCTTYISQSLAMIQDKRASTMADAAIRALANEMEPGGLWRYWCKDAAQYKQIPFDVDDTACASDALRRFGTTFPDNREILLANRNSDGLFYTWIVPRLRPVKNLRWWWLVLTDVTYGRVIDFWRAGAGRGDVDSVVNANVLHYLGKTPETGVVAAWLIDVARNQAEDTTDRWYRSKPAFYFAASRCYASNDRHLEELKPFVAPALTALSFDDGRIGADALQTSMAICALDNFEIPLGERLPSLRYLIDTQRSDGGWDWCPFYYDGRETPLIFWGSRATTTGFCLEALARYSKSNLHTERA